MTIVGECSICGGKVETPDIWLGQDPPIPTCRSCGATMQMCVIPMRPARENAPRFDQITAADLADSVIEWIEKARKEDK